MTSIEMAVMAANIERVTKYNIGVDDIESTADDFEDILKALEFGKAFPGENNDFYDRIKGQFPAMAADVLITLLTMARRHDIGMNEVFDEFNKAIKK